MWNYSSLTAVPLIRLTLGWWIPPPLGCGGFMYVYAVERSHLNQSVNIKHVEVDQGKDKMICIPVSG